MPAGCRLQFRRNSFSEICEMKSHGVMEIAIFCHDMFMTSMLFCWFYVFSQFSHIMSYVSSILFNQFQSLVVMTTNFPVAQPPHLEWTVGTRTNECFPDLQNTKTRRFQRKQFASQIVWRFIETKNYRCKKESLGTCKTLQTESRGRSAVLVPSGGGVALPSTEFAHTFSSFACSFTTCFL